MATVAPPLQVRAQAELELRRRRAAERRERQEISFRDFAGIAKPDIEWDRHTVLIADEIQRLIDGDIPRLFCAMPPQAGKSTLSRLAAAYFLWRFPQLWVGVSSYNQTYANKNSRYIRRYYTTVGGVLAGDAYAVENWELPEGGGCWAVGVGGGTGNTASLLLADDLVKGTKEADSKKQQEDAVEWYVSSWVSRWSAYAKQGMLREMLIGTRWADTDVQGWALKERSWRCIILPAIYPEHPVEAPDGCELVEDWRDPGEALSEDREKLNLKDLLAQKKLLRNKPRRWEALYQQSPRPEEGGGMFRDWWFPILEVDPALLPGEDGEPLGSAAYVAQGRAWDLAGTQDGGDETVSILAGETEDGLFVIREGESLRDEPLGVKEAIRRKMLEDGPHVAIGLPQDPGQAGKFQFQEMADFLRAEAAKAGMTPPRIEGMPTRESKKTRATALRDAAEPAKGDKDNFVPGRVRIVRGRWVAPLLYQLHRFTGVEGNPDDWVDPAGDVYRLITGRPRSFYG